MAVNSNKIRYNLRNVHYAVITHGEDGTISFGVPVAIPGAVSIDLSAEGEQTPFWADGVVYYTTTSNGGYSGSLEIALIPDDFRKEILKETEDATDKVIYERADVNPAPFALLFEFDGDRRKIKRVLYNVAATRPNITGETSTDTREPQTETLELTATSAEINSMPIVSAKTGDNTTEAAYANWYNTVWTPQKPLEEAI